MQWFTYADYDFGESFLENRSSLGPDGVQEWRSQIDALDLHGQELFNFRHSWIRVRTPRVQVGGIQLSMTFNLQSRGNQTLVYGRGSFEVFIDGQGRLCALQRGVNGWSQITGESTITNGQWHTARFGFDGKGTLSLQLDDDPVWQAQTLSALQPVGPDIFIGHNPVRTPLGDLGNLGLYRHASVLFSFPDDLLKWFTSQNRKGGLSIEAYKTLLEILQGPSRLGKSPKQREKRLAELYDLPLFSVSKKTREAWRKIFATKRVRRLLQRLWAGQTPEDEIVRALKELAAAAEPEEIQAIQKTLDSLTATEDRKILLERIERLHPEIRAIRRNLEELLGRVK